MSAKRKAIRAAVAELLEDDEIVEAGNVFSNRATPLWDVPLPAILVYARDEGSVPMSENDAGGPLKRTLALAIEARTGLSQTLDDDLDDLAEEIESAIRADHTLGGLAVQSVLAGTEIDTSSEGSKPFGAIRLTYEVLYSDIAPEEEEVP